MPTTAVKGIISGSPNPVTTVIPGAGMEVPYLASCLPLSTSSPFVQYYPTNALTAGNAALHRMYLSLDEASPIKAFLTNRAQALYKPFEENTPVPRAYLDPAVLKELPCTVALGPTFNTSSGFLPAVPTVYVLTREGVCTFPAYCGVGINGYSRQASHYFAFNAALRHLEDPLYTKRPLPLYRDAISHGTGLAGYLATPIYHAPDYCALFTSEGFTPTPLERYILDSHTYQHLFAVEQAYSMEARPYTYGGADITVYHRKWMPGGTAAIDNRGSVSVSWVTDKGVEGYAPSITRAVSVLRLTPETIRNNANCLTPHYIEAHPGNVRITLAGCS